VDRASLFYLLYLLDSLLDREDKGPYYASVVLCLNWHSLEVEVVHSYLQRAEESREASVEGDQEEEEVVQIEVREAVVDRISFSCKEERLVGIEHSKKEEGEGEERRKGRRQSEELAEGKEKVQPFEQLVLVQLERRRHNKQHIERRRQLQLDLLEPPLQELGLECKLELH